MEFNWAKILVFPSVEAESQVFFFKEKFHSKPKQMILLLSYLIVDYLMNFSFQILFHVFFMFNFFSFSFRFEIFTFF